VKITDRLRQVILLLCLIHFAPAFAHAEGVAGDPGAIERARHMVESMGGAAIWEELHSLHFVHTWYPYSRLDAYTENEILDLTGARSWVEMKSEVYHRVRAYSPESGYWSMSDGDVSVGNEQRLEAAMARAPYSLYRLARSIARDDSRLRIEQADGDIPGSKRIEFYWQGATEPGGWVILNARHEPIVWATTQYRYTFGPMRFFGNLRVPDWAVYDNGGITYEMVSLTGDRERPPASLFVRPEDSG